MLIEKQPKQETLEEAAEKWVFKTNGHKWSNNNNEVGDNYGSFIAGAKWQQERMYSEDDMHNLMDEYQEWLVLTLEPIKPFKEWFEQFKK